MLPRSALLAALALVLALCPGARAQFATPSLPFVQAGVAGAPGVGVQAGFATPAFNVLTREGALYAEYDPSGVGEMETLRVGLGLGGSVRVLRALTVLADLDAGPFDLDLGFRFGPSFLFSLSGDETAESKARSFTLFAEPFARGSVRLGRRVLYLEAGTHPARLRAGLLLGL